VASRTLHLVAFIDLFEFLRSNFGPHHGLLEFKVFLVKRIAILVMKGVTFCFLAASESASRDAAAEADKFGSVERVKRFLIGPKRGTPFRGRIASSQGQTQLRAR
jgi:hypothetical protein